MSEPQLISAACSNPLDSARARVLNLWPALLVCMGLPTLMTWVEVRWILPLSPEARPPWVDGLFVFGKLLQFSLPLLFVILTDPRRLRLARPSARGMRAGLIFASIGAAGTFTLYFGFLRGSPLLGDTPANIHNWLEKFGFNGVGGFFAFGFLICVPHAFLEEYYWRWFVFDRLKQRMNWLSAAVLSSLAFTSHHLLVLAYYLPHHFLTLGLVLALTVAIGGFVWAWIYHRSGNLYACWVSHLLVDAVIILVGWDMSFG